MSVPAGTRFIGIQPGVDMVERKSSQANSPTEVYTIEDIQVNAVPYTGATGNVDLGEYELKAGQIELDQSPTGTAGVAVTRWNNTIGSTETTLKGGSVILKNGVDLVARVVNNVTPNATLTKAAYPVVRVSGAQGQRLAVAYAQANNDNNSADTLGVVIETIPTNQEGFIMTVGQLEDINTTGSLQGEDWDDGDVLYLSPTIPGAITKVKPTGATGHIVVIGYVEYAHVNHGKIYVKIMNGWELDELHNVYINPATLANNQVLTYESSTQLWKNQTPNTGITVGTTPSTGTDGRVFFQAGGVVQQSDRFTFDNTTATNILQLGAGANLGVSLRTIAPGATSADIAFRVRNSADGNNLFSIRGDQAIEMIASTPSTNGGILITKTDNYNSPRIQLYNVFSQLTDINGSTITTSNVKVGNSGAAGFIGFVTPSGQERFLKFVNLFGQETLSIGGNNYDGAATFTMKSWSGAPATNVFTIARTDNTKPFVISNEANIGIGGTTFGASAQFVTAQYTGVAPTTSPADAYQQYSADITANNAAPHFRTENGAIVKVYQETTAVAASTLVGNAGANITDTDTFDGYTLKQIVKALRNQGLLA